MFDIRHQQKVIKSAESRSYSKFGGCQSLADILRGRKVTNSSLL